MAAAFIAPRTQARSRAELQKIVETPSLMKAWAVEAKALADLAKTVTTNAERLNFNAYLQAMKDERAILQELIAKNKWDYDHQFAATPDQIKSSACKHTAPNTAQLQEYFQALDKKTTAGKTSKVLSGISFENEDPALLAAFGNLFYVSKYEEDQTPISLEARARVPANCHRVLCAMTAIYGKDAGLRLLYLSEHFKINAAQEPATVNLGEFSVAQLNAITEALLDAPPFLLPTKAASSLNLLRSKAPDDCPTCLAELDRSENIIRIYPGWNEKKPEIRRYTLFHELAHHFGDRLAADNIKSGWKNFSSSADGTEVAISPYGASNHKEDFAEAISAYRYDPKRLKEVSPKKYAYLRDTVFLGVEYLDSSNCSGAPPAFNEAAQALETFRLPTSELNPGSIPVCRPEVMNLGSNHDPAKLDRFLTGQIQTASVSYVLKDYAAGKADPAGFIRSFEKLDLTSNLTASYQVTPEQTYRLKLETYTDLDRALSEALAKQSAKAAAAGIEPRDGESDADFCKRWLAGFTANIPSDSSFGPDLKRYGPQLGSFAQTSCQDLASRGPPLTSKAFEGAMLRNYPKDIFLLLLKPRLEQAQREALVIPGDNTTVSRPVWNPVILPK